MPLHVKPPEVGGQNGLFGCHDQPADDLMSFSAGNEFCERLAYYGLATNLITYMRTEMLEEPAFAAIMVQLFEGTCYLTPLLGAWLADSRWGRYKTILVFSAIYVLVSVNVETDSQQRFVFAAALSLGHQGHTRLVCCGSDGDGCAAM